MCASTCIIGMRFSSRIFLRELQPGKKQTLNLPRVEKSRMAHHETNQHLILGLVHPTYFCIVTYHIRHN